MGREKQIATKVEVSGKWVKLENPILMNPKVAGKIDTGGEKAKETLNSFFKWH